jgi:hypothetical protein
VTYSKLCLFTLVLAGVGAVASIQADTIFISFVLLAVTAFLYSLCEEGSLQRLSPRLRRSAGRDRLPIRTRIATFIFFVVLPGIQLKS